MKITVTIYLKIASSSSSYIYGNTETNANYGQNRSIQSCQTFRFYAVLARTFFVLRALIFDAHNIDAWQLQNH